MANYLVTGGAGFIGSHAVEALVRRGHRVRVIDNLSSSHRRSLEAVAGDVELIEADIRDADALARAMMGITYVLHQAAIASVPRSIAAPLETDSVNVGGGLAVLCAARDAGVKRIVIASSSSVYGPKAPTPTRETTPVAPASPYAASKATMDMYAKVFTELYGIEVVGLRYFNVFGPRQDPASQYAAVVPKFITELLHGRAPEIHGDGSQSRDFCYIEDVIEANIAACEWSEPLSGVYNIARGESTSILDLYESISRSLGVNLSPTHTPSRAGDIPVSLADCSAAKQAFGFASKTPVAEGLARTVAWYRAAAEK